MVIIEYDTKHTARIVALQIKWCANFQLKIGSYHIPVNSSLGVFENDLCLV